MSDLVFLLLIFFMITSTLISPNVVNLSLPESNNKTMAKQNLTVTIDKGENPQMYVDNDPVAEGDLQSRIAAGIEPGLTDACVVLKADESVAVKHIVKVIDAVNNINSQSGTKHKVVLATSTPKAE